MQSEVEIEEGKKLRRKGLYPTSELCIELPVAIYRTENKWFSDMMNVVNKQNRVITIENIYKEFTSEEIEAEIKKMVKAGRAYPIKNEERLPTLSPLMKKQLMWGLKRALMNVSERYKKLYASDGITTQDILDNEILMR